MTVVSQERFKTIVSSYGEYFPYDLEPNAIEATLKAEHFCSNGVQYLFLKADWHVTELLAFNGREFVEACAFIFFSNAAAPEQLSSADRFYQPWHKLEHIIEYQRLARKEGHSVRVHSMALGRSIWKLSRFSHKRKITFLKRLADSLFRKYARYLVAKYVLDISLQQQLHLCLNELQVMSKRGER